MAYPKKTSYLVNNSSDRDVPLLGFEKKGEKGNASNIYLDIFLYNVIDFEYWISRYESNARSLHNVTIN